MGAGRSGTTLLDIILGNSECIFSCGELTRFPELRGVPHNYPTGSTTFQFWNKFVIDLRGELSGEIDFEQLSCLYRKFDHHEGFLLNALNRHERLDYDFYKKYLNAFFALIFEKTGSEVLIDSSKYPNRVITMARAVNYQICLIYLVRHPVGVVKSFGKTAIEQPSRKWLSANLYYFIVNLACSITARLVKKRVRYIKIRYDDFISDPVKILKKIEDVFSINLSDSRELFKKGQNFQVGCLFDGNRLRLNKEVAIKNSKTNISSVKDFFSFALNCIWWY